MIDPRAIARGLARVRERIATAAHAAGRSPDDVALLAVSKRQPAEALRIAYDLGQRDFGESYVQELCSKAEALGDLPDLRLHMIGHLQSNKVGRLLPHTRTIHSVDRTSLVTELAKRASQLPLPLPMPLPVGVYVEVNVSGEPQKSGSAPQSLADVLAAVEAQPRWLQLLGLMTVPPNSDDPAVAERTFSALAELRELHGGQARLPGLSIGMSSDLEAAIRAGSTIVRIGTAVFGERS